MTLLAALGARVLRREPLRQATGFAVRLLLLDDQAAACQASTTALPGEHVAEAASSGAVSCAPPMPTGEAAAAAKSWPAGSRQLGVQRRGFAAAAAAAPGSLPVSPVGTIYIVSSSNNVICTLADGEGRTLGWCSAGSLGFKHSRKSTTFAAQATGERIAAKCLQKGVVQVRLVLKGLGFGKMSAARALIKSGLQVTEIHEHTAIPYNGCRAPKRRRG